MRLISTTNLVLTVISILLLLWVFVDLIIHDNDGIVWGYAFPFLVGLTVYYLLLLYWAIRLFKKRSELESRDLAISWVLLVLNIAPVVWIYSWNH